ncbi:TPA: MATE family efflux transporter [Streptococcus suis]|uniref:MATE family efflux transporter n=1 Tax=Streptococcus suis TaxID=1307 RepID=UPI000942F697|nr:MATE family efflux transporter [Streptococcus suis]NQQ73542.1 MATE family efflux transporter [Streptococcus suis]HEM5596772.1 MATE family efflux transporter [Streptococcus suis]
MKQESLGKEIIRLSLPATVENIFQTLVGFVDTLLIAQLGLVAVTAVGLANTILNVYLAVYMALGVGATALIARSIGAGDRESLTFHVRQALVLSVGVLFGLLSLVFGRQMLVLMGADAESLAGAQAFFYWVGGLTIFQALMTILGTILRASGDTVSPMKMSLLTNGFNVVLDYFLIFGIGSWSGLGIVGTALGTVLARLLGTVLLYRKVQQTDVAVDLKQLFRLGSPKEMVVLTLPAAAERLVMRLGQVVYFSLIVGLGTTVYASHMIAGNIESFTYMPAYGLATAAAVLIGQALGKGYILTVRRVAFISSAYGVAIMSLLGTILFFGAPSFALLFTKDLEAVRQVVTALRIDAFNQPGLAVSLIMAGALQGLGDTKSPLYSTMIGMWGLRVVGVIVLGQMFGLGIAGVWLSILIDLLLRAIFLTWRFIVQTRKLAE